MTEYHHWINGQAYRLILRAVYGENEKDKSGHFFFCLSKFHFFAALNGAFIKVQFFQIFIFTVTLSKTLIACRDMQLRFLKWKQLLNTAFWHWLLKLQC